MRHAAVTALQRRAAQEETRGQLGAHALRGQLRAHVLEHLGGRHSREHLQRPPGCIWRERTPRMTRTGTAFG
jgi:hypothetical protein